MADNQLQIDLIINDKEALAKLKAALNDVGGAAKESTSSINTGFITAAASAAAALVVFNKIVDVLKDSVTAAAEQEQAIVRLNTSMKIQGTLTAGLSEHYQKFAADMQKLTRYTEEDILMVEQRLISIGNVGPAQLTKTTRAVLDLAAATGIDLERASTMLSKAFEGDTARMTSQLPVLKDLIKENATFAEILDAINQKFGGYSTASNSYTDSNIQLKKAVGEVYEELGNFIVKSPEVIAAYQSMTDHAYKLAEGIKRIREEDPQAVTHAITNALVSAGQLLSYSPAMLGTMVGQSVGKSLVEQALGTESQNKTDADKNLAQVKAAAEKALQVKTAIAQDEVKVAIAANLAKQKAMIAQFKSDIEMAQATADLVNAVANLSGKSSVKAVGIVLQAVVTAVNIMMTTVNPFLALLQIATTAVSAASALNQLAQAEKALEAAKSDRITAVTNIQGFASGGLITRGGAVLVGERGPEIVTLPAGAGVTANGQSPSMTVNIHFNGNINASEDSAREFARQVSSYVSDFIDSERARL